MQVKDLAAAQALTTIPSEPKLCNHSAAQHVCAQQCRKGIGFQLENLSCTGSVRHKSCSDLCPKTIKAQSEGSLAATLRLPRGSCVEVAPQRDKQCTDSKHWSHRHRDGFNHDGIPSFDMAPGLSCGCLSGKQEARHARLADCFGCRGLVSFRDGFRALATSVRRGRKEIRKRSPHGLDAQSQSLIIQKSTPWPSTHIMLTSLCIRRTARTLKGSLLRSETMHTSTHCHTNTDMKNSTPHLLLQNSHAMLSEFGSVSLWAASALSIAGSPPELGPAWTRQRSPRKTQAVA